MVVGLKCLNDMSMKMIGFRERFERVLMRSEYFYASDPANALPISTEERQAVINYLESSDRVFSMTLAQFDGEYYIGPYMLFSDGEWIWPSYFSYFISKGEPIDRSFLQHLRERNFSSKSLTAEERKKVVTLIEIEMMNSSKKS